MLLVPKRVLKTGDSVLTKLAAWSQDMGTVCCFLWTERTKAFSLQATFHSSFHSVFNQ